MNIPIVCAGACVEAVDIIAADDYGVCAVRRSDADEELKARIGKIRLAAGQKMYLGNVSEKTVPKTTLFSKPTKGGTISTRSFIPHRVHTAVGVSAAVSIGSMCLLNSGPAAQLAKKKPTGNPTNLRIEYPSGSFGMIAHLCNDGSVQRAGVVRTARKLMDGEVF